MTKCCVLVLAIVCVCGRVEGKYVDETKIEHAAASDTKNYLDIDNNLNIEDHSYVQDNKIDNGTALLLTPFIEDGSINEARNASKVDPSKFLGLESYSGFLTVDKVLKSHLFFWYFPNPKPANDTPWIIWLQGGPGGSSLTGLFNEIGPFRVQPDGTLIRNPFTWLANHSLVFLDNPVGSGYSYTESADGYAKDMSTYAKHMHTAVKQLVQIFPELRVAPLYVAGESYGGKFVPALGVEIHRHKNEPGGDINLKGLLIGNGYVEPEMMSQIVRPFYYFGLLEKEQVEFIRPLLEGFQSDIANNRSVEAKQKWNSLIVMFLMLSHKKHAYNFLHDELAAGNFAAFLSSSEIKRALHVGDIKFSIINATAGKELEPDFLSNARPLFEELLDHYRVLAYCGQLDLMMPCAFTSEIYRKWKWSDSDAFLESTRHSFLLNRKVAGYHKSGGGLTWAVIRGAGHMVPIDEPEPVQRLVALWTHSAPIPSGKDVDTDMLARFMQNSSTPNADMARFLFNRTITVDLGEED